MKIVVLIIMVIGISFLFQKEIKLNYLRIDQNFRITKIDEDKIKLVSGDLSFYIRERSKINKKVIGRKLRVKATLKKDKRKFKTISIREEGKPLSFSLISDRIVKTKK